MMHTIKPLNRPGWLVWTGLLALVWTGAASAVDITTNTDTAAAPFPAGSLRQAITDINAGNASGPLNFNIPGGPGNVTINLAASLPALTAGKNVSVSLANRDVTINGGGSGYNIFSGDIHNINATGNFQLTLSSSNTPINISPGANVSLNRINVTGGGGGTVTVNNAGYSVTMQGVEVTGNKTTGAGIAVTGYNVVLRGITVQQSRGVGVAATASNSFTMETLAREALGGNTWPAYRMHNFIGFNPAYSAGADGVLSIRGIGLQAAFANNSTVTDLDVGNCTSHAIQLDPTGGTPSLTVRRIHVGSMADGSKHPVRGDGLRILGGRVDMGTMTGEGTFGGRGRIGHADDAKLANLNFADDDPAAVYRHQPGDLGITTSLCADGVGIRIGLPDDPINGTLALTHARSGPSVDGLDEATEGRGVDDPAQRRQSGGIDCYVNNGPLAIDNCQASGVIQRGVYLRGNTRVVFRNNNVGLRADAQTVLPTSDQPLAVGNGRRSYFEGTEYPSSVTGGEGVRIETAGLLMGFNGNVISGNAQDGLVMGPQVLGTATPPIVPVTSPAYIGVGSTDTWNHIGVQGRGVEGGRGTYGGGSNPTVGRKLVAAGGKVASDPATGYIGGEMGTPRVRGNGTTIFSSGGGSAQEARGSGFIYQGSGMAVVRGITISDNAVNGLVIDTPQGNIAAGLVLVRARIGVDDTGNGPTDQSLGNGTISRGGTGVGAYTNIRNRQGVGIYINGDGRNVLGIGSDTYGLPIGNGNIPFTNIPYFNTADRNVIASNLLYGIQLSNNVGMGNGPLSTSVQVAASRIGTSLDGTSAGSVDFAQGSLGFGNGHVMADASDMMVFGDAYPNVFGAGIRVEPNATGRHLIGGDDTGDAGPEDALQITTADNKVSERNVIANNGLAGVWLRGEGSVAVAGNYIGASATGLALPTGASRFCQRYGVLVEQPEFLLHQAVTGAGQGANPMLPQYIGQIPFPDMNGVNTDVEADGGGPGRYGNLIVGATLWGVAIEDDASHVIVANYLGMGRDGTTVLSNGGSLPMGLGGVLHPQHISGGGIEIGALNQGISAGRVQVGVHRGGNLISGNQGHGVAQYRSGVVSLVDNVIGADSAMQPAPNLWGVTLFGGADNEVRHNLISGNTNDGLVILGSGNNVVIGNTIGLDGAGTAKLGNGLNGIRIASSATGSNTIGQSGKDVAGNERRNLIGANGLSGILIEGPGANLVRSNYIGVGADGHDAAGAAGPLGNGAGNAVDQQEGILITGTGNQIIGGATVDSHGINTDGNVISGNTGRGIVITEAATGNNAIRGNLIGLDGHREDDGTGGWLAPDEATYGVTAEPNGLGGIVIGATSGTNLVRDNVISGNTGHGLEVASVGQTTIRANRVGTSRLGDAAVGNGQHGIVIASDTVQRIGLANSSESVLDNGNLISGNLGDGLELGGAASHEVYGNFIGTDRTGAVALPNGLSGIASGAPSDAIAPVIGGTLSGQFNLISGNTGVGVSITGDGNHLIRGNRIGLNLAGGDGLANGGGGLELAGSGTNLVAENRISGNQGAGVSITAGTNTLLSNRIGPNLTGEAELATPGTGPGIEINAPTMTTQVIGVAGTGNIISGNGGDGIVIGGASNVEILANLIGVNVAGTSDLGNRGHGIRIGTTSGQPDGGDIVIGGTGTNEQNIISGNEGFGILHEGRTAPVIQNNRIGTNATANAAIANDTGGVRFASTQAGLHLLLGGSEAEQGNVISGNGGPGVVIAASNASPVELLGNLIGVNAAGAVALGNASRGVLIELGNDADNVIGGPDPGDRNTISGNGTDQYGHGIHVRGSGRNLIENNSLGGDRLGDGLAGNVGNTGDGVRLANNTAGNVVRNNVIRDNGYRGIVVEDTAERQQLTGNRIIDNGLTRSGLQVTELRLPIDLGNDNAVGTAGNANKGLEAPVLQHVVAASGGQFTVAGTVAVGTTRVEVYRASDPMSDQVESDVTQVAHHGGAEKLLETVTLAPTATAFSTSVTIDDTVLDGKLVTALAFDADGNTSEFSRNVGVVSADQSGLVADPSTVVADGTTASQVTVTLRDAIGTTLVGVEGVTLGFEPDFSGLQGPAAPLAATDAAGQTTGLVRANRAGTTEVTAASGGVTIPGAGQEPARIAFTPANLDASQSEFEADQTQVRSDGIDTVTFTFTIRDLNGDPIESFDAEALRVYAEPAAGVTITQPGGVTDANGQVTATAIGTVGQEVVFTGRLGGVNGTVIPSPRTVTFVAVPLDPATSTVTVIGSPVANDDVSAANIRVVVRNENGQLMTGLAPVLFEPTAEAPAQQVTFGAAAEDGDSPGTYYIPVHSSVIQTVTVRVTVQGVLLNQSGQVEFVAGAPTAGSSTLQVTPTEAVADGEQEITATVTIRDGQGQPVANVPVTLVVAPETGISALPAAVTDADGRAVVTFTGTAGGDYQVSAIAGPPPGNFTLGPQGVRLTANPADPDASRVEVSPDEIVADNAETATIAVTLIDAQGRPMVGVQPTEVVIEATPDTGLTVTQPASASDGDGLITGALRGTTSGEVTIQVRVRGQALNARPTVILSAYTTMHFPIGTHFMAIPATPVDPSPEAVFAPLLPNLRLARWQPTEQRYARYVQGTAEPLLNAQPGRGFWLQLDRVADLRIVGEPAADGPVEVSTAQGWNQVGNPYTGQFDFRLNQIEVLKDGASVGTLDSAAAAELVDPYAWKWDLERGYLLVLDPASAGAATIPGQIDQFQGFWMLVRQPGVSLRLNGPSRSASSRATRSRAASPTGWMVSLQAAAGGQISQANVMGIGASRLAAALPPEGPEAPVVRLSFRDEQGRAAATDIRTGPLTGRARWTALVDAPAGEDVILSWPGISRGLPSGMRLWLVDPTNGRRTLMNSRASYNYRQGDGTREFVVEADPRGERTLNVTNLQVRPGRGRAAGVPIEFSLTAPATVTVQVKGLRGTVIRTLRDEAAEGTGTLSWDGLDETGRRVPAGVYHLELTATTDAGEIARVTRQVRID